MWLPSPIVRFLWGTPLVRDAMQTRLDRQRCSLPKTTSEKYLAVPNFDAGNLPFQRTLNWVIKIPVPPGPAGDSWGDLYFARDLAASLSRLGQNVRIDQRNAINDMTEADEVQIVIRGLEKVTANPNAINILWIISTPELVTRHERRQYQLVYAASKKWVHEKSTSRLPIKELLQCTNPEKFRPMIANEPKLGITFVGNARKRKRKIIRDCESVGLTPKIYGKGWENQVNPELIQAQFVDNALISQLYANSEFVLNDHRPDMASRGFVSNRIFDAVAAGARVITDSVDGISEIFGKNVREYVDAQDLLHLTRNISDFGDSEYLLEQSNKIRELHNFDQRAKVLLIDVLNLVENQESKSRQAFRDKE